MFFFFLIPPPYSPSPAPAVLLDLLAPVLADTAGPFCASSFCISLLIGIHLARLSSLNPHGNVPGLRLDTCAFSPPCSPMRLHILLSRFLSSVKIPQGAMRHGTSSSPNNEATNATLAAWENRMTTSPSLHASIKSVKIGAKRSILRKYPSGKDSHSPTPACGCTSSFARGM